MRRSSRRTSRSRLTDIDTAATQVVVDRLADERSDVLVLSGAASRGVALQFVIELSQLRTGVAMLDGNPVDAARSLALAGALTGAPPTIVAIDIRRYDRWVVDTLAARVRARGMGGGGDRQRALAPRIRGRSRLPGRRGVAGAVRQPRRDAGAARRTRRRRGGSWTAIGPRSASIARSRCGARPMP